MLDVSMLNAHDLPRNYNPETDTLIFVRNVAFIAYSAPDHKSGDRELSRTLSREHNAQNPKSAFNVSRAVVLDIRKVDRNTWMLVNAFGHEFWTIFDNTVNTLECIKA